MRERARRRGLEEPLTPQHLERPLDPLAPVGRQLVPRRAPPEQARHRVEIELVAVQRAERGLQTFRPAPGFGVDEGGTEDVG